MMPLIPKHITALYLYMVLNLLALIHLKLAVADVIVILQNQTKATYYDYEAAFGPDIPSDGIRGYLMPVKPLNGCQEVEKPPFNQTNWIALIKRDNCTFREKVLHAQIAGFAAVIVYNSDGRELIHMSGDGADIYIPSVMVSWSDGMELQLNYCYECNSVIDEMNGQYEIIIDDKEHHETLIPPILWPFAIVIGTCFVVMLGFVALKWCRDVRRKKKSRLSTNHLKKIPTKKFKKGDEYDACAICLDDYEEGDKLRVLPCSHVYHCACVDPWLTKNKRSCPVCKRKVIPGSSADGDSSEEENGNSTSNTPSERTPLLGNVRNNSSAPRSTFDNSGLPEAVRTQVRHVNEEEDENDDDLDSELAETSQRGRTNHEVDGEGSYSSSFLSTSSEEEENVIEEVMYAEPNHVTHSESNKTEDTKKTNHVV